MTTMADLLSIHTTQAQMSSFFIDRMGIYNVKSYGAIGDGVTDDTLAIQATVDAIDSIGGTMFFPAGKYLVTKQSGQSCAIRLKSWITYKGVGIATTSGTEYATRIILDDNQNCDVFGNYDSDGLSGCQIRDLGIDGNRANNTTGHGVYIKSWWSNTLIDNVKIGQTAEDGIHIADTSTPINISNVMIGANGGNGIYIAGNETNAVALINVQIDNAGVSGGANLAGIKFNAGSTQDTNATIVNYRYEQNVTVDANATDVGLLVNSMNSATVTVLGAYGFSNKLTGTKNFIKINTNYCRLNMISVLTNANYTNILNDTVNSHVFPYATKGIPCYLEEVNIIDALKIRSRELNGVVTMTTSQASGRLAINHSSDGGTGGNIDFYQGTTALKANIDGNGTFFSASGSVKLGGASESAADCFILRGTGSPEGVVTGKPGSLYLNISGGAGTTLYMKESGTGNTGWVSK